MTIIISFLGAEGHGLVCMVVMGSWLDLTILEVFFNLYDSMILFLCVFVYGSLGAHSWAGTTGQPTAGGI